MAADNRAALLIDADNLSPEGMEHALAHLLAQDLNVCVRRAYGSPETLAGVREFLQANAVRAIVNQGKGTTDAALVVDVMDLLHGGTLPPVVAIGSGDGDFAPLVLRLRECGRTMICFAQRKKAAEGLERFYARVVHVDAPARGASRSEEPPPAPARKTGTRKAAPKAAAAAKQQQPAALTVAQRVREVLGSFPAFLDGEEIELNAVVKKLRDEQLMTKSTSARNFFRQHAPEVELVPEKQPNRLRWGGA
jgi:hypothetical protein